MKPARVCPVPSCPSLMPCPTHAGRPKNAHWSKDRDRKTQHHFRAATLKQDNWTCQRCGHHDPTGRTLDAHHASPTVGRTLCNSKANGCHRLEDQHAR